MLISFREAADLGFQIVLSISVVVAGMSLATVATRSNPNPLPKIDVTKPVLWAATPVRIDRHVQLFASSLLPGASSGPAAGDICTDGIGLRIACDLIVANRRPS